MNGCGSSSPAPRHPASDPAIPATASAVEKKLREAVAPWLGTAYRLGGMSRGGVDCSGLVVRVFADHFGRRLPRTTKTQVEVGMKISRPDLLPGDLVFFKRRSGSRHVGIYLGQREFVHSSGQRGVTISNIDTPYWREVFWMARRVL